MEVVTKNAEATCKLGKRIGNSLKQKVAKQGKALVVGLVGPLGGGKTTFVKGLALGLGITARITSPTFVLMRQYLAKPVKLYHIDLYRIDDAEQELKILGFEELLHDKNSIIAIEWADKVKNLPKDTFWVEFTTDVVDRDVRLVKL